MVGPFDHVSPTPDQHALMAGLRRKFASLHEDLLAVLPAGDHKDYATQRLHEAAMWANKAITHTP